MLADLAFKSFEQPALATSIRQTIQEEFKKQALSPPQQQRPSSPFGSDFGKQVVGPVQFVSGTRTVPGFGPFGSP